MGKWLLKERAYQFSLSGVRLTCKLQMEFGEYILTRQLLRSSSAVGAMVREAEFAESSADFIHKLSVALKEANEAGYWLDLLVDSGLATQEVAKHFRKECHELISILASTLITLKRKKAAVKDMERKRK